MKASNVKTIMSVQTMSSNISVLSGTTGMLSRGLLSRCRYTNLLTGVGGI